MKLLSILTIFTLKLLCKIPPQGLGNLFLLQSITGDVNGIIYYRFEFMSITDAYIENADTLAKKDKILSKPTPDLHPSIKRKLTSTNKKETMNTTNGRSVTGSSKGAGLRLITRNDYLTYHLYHTDIKASILNTLCND